MQRTQFEFVLKCPLWGSEPLLSGCEGWSALPLAADPSESAGVDRYVPQSELGRSGRRAAGSARVTLFSFG
jgi:hypothetical protein